MDPREPGSSPWGRTPARRSRWSASLSPARATTSWPRSPWTTPRACSTRWRPAGGWATTRASPANAVVLHPVDPTRKTRPSAALRWWTPTTTATRTTPARMWTPGETFTDAANGITVTVNAQTATGFQVTIKRGTAGAWVSRASMPTARRALAVAVANGTLLRHRRSERLGHGAPDGAGLQSDDQRMDDQGARFRRLGKAAMAPSRSTGSLPARRRGRRRRADPDAVRLQHQHQRMEHPRPDAGVRRLRRIGRDRREGLCLQRLHPLQHRRARSTRGCCTGTTRPPIPGPRSRPAPVTHFRPVVAAIGGKLYVAGGNNAAGTALRRVDVYDPATNTWSLGAAMPTARVNAGAAFLQASGTSSGGKKRDGLSEYSRGLRSGRQCLDQPARHAHGTGGPGRRRCQRADLRGRRPQRDRCTRYQRTLHALDRR